MQEVLKYTNTFNNSFKLLIIRENTNFDNNKNMSRKQFP